MHLLGVNTDLASEFIYFCTSFTFQKLYIVPVGNQSDIPYTRVNHNKYMVTDEVAYIGEFIFMIIIYC